MSTNSYPPDAGDPVAYSAAAARAATVASGRANTPSAVSWGAILAGAAGAAALSLILLILGTGLGLSSVSPWAQRGVEASTLGFGAVLWITFTQLAASGVGGYLAGRLRTRWLDLQRDEVFFRDTAHGFLAWAVASLATAALLTSAIGIIVGGGVQAGATLAGGAAGTAATAATVAGTGAATRGASDVQGGSDAVTGYFIDTLFRPAASTATGTAPSEPGTPAAAGTPATPPGRADAGEVATQSANVPAGTASSRDQSGPARSPVRGDAAGNAAQSREIARIFANSLRTGTLPSDDLHYVAGLVSERTGLPQSEAERRVNATFANLKQKLQEAGNAAREAADTARKASAKASLWLFVSLLVGAFVASLAATRGGRQRDL
ncbi:hypothetical protein [Xylophilus sp.]|uniref:hypothetical protein n=1 Tax=Xylophilus sp. TaxID=2653893 RepID=UPI0013B5EE42|nr:hypothetical protein [Xylophilus sp.]KAF1043249.1 MAG: hypothetical protein GAK38_04048 [Xylophilus sp.]